MSNKINFIFLSRLLAICIVIAAFHLIAPRSYAAWTSLGLSSTSLNMVAVDPTNANTIYAISGTSVYKTTDGGTTWNSINNGLPNLQNLGLSDIEFNPQNTSVLYLVSWADNRGGGQPGVFKTTDGGANWTDLSANIGTTNPDFKSIAVDPHNPNTVFIGSGAGCNGIWKTTDGGTTWTHVQSPACDISGLAVDPNNSNIVYATEPSVYKSTDGGITYTDIGQNTAAFNNNAIVSIAIDPKNSNNLYVGPSTSSSPFMYKSTDAGATWTAVSGLDCHIGAQKHVVVTDPIVDNTVFFASSCQNVDRSTDAGSTWSSNNLPGANPLGLYAPVSNPGAIYAATTQGVYVDQFPVPTNIQIEASPSTGILNVGAPTTINVKVTDSNTSNPFNAAAATVTVSSNLTVLGINNPATNSCNFNYTQSPTKSDPSFAGAIYNGSSTGCTVYTMVVSPKSTGTGTVTFSNAQIKAYSNNAEILTGVQNGSYTINAAVPTPTPPGTTLVTVDDSVQGSGLNQWNYVGNWNHCTDTSNPACNPNLYNNSVSWDNTTDDYATITFNGRQVILYGLVDPNHGIAGVSIDGGAETNVDFYSSTRQGDVQLWTSPLLALGQHTLKVRVTGTKNANSGGTYLALDRLDIIQNSPSNIAVTNPVFVTYGPTFTITGTRDASITHVIVNGSESGVTYPTSTTWQAVVNVSLGNNNFTIYGKDDFNNQTASIPVTVNMHKLGDINGDGQVDLTDASLFAVDYGKTDPSTFTYPLSDMNNDGRVDLQDLSILAKNEQ